MSDTERILDLARQLRAKIRPGDTLHGWWDAIFDMEAFARGQQTVVQMSAAEWIGYAEGLLHSHGGGPTSGGTPACA